MNTSNLEKREMNLLTQDLVSEVSGGAPGDFEYYGEYVLEELESGLQRLSMFMVMEGELMLEQDASGALVSLI
jgi:hypothetical protein